MKRINKINTSSIFDREMQIKVFCIFKHADIEEMFAWHHYGFDFCIAGIKYNAASDLI